MSRAQGGVMPPSGLIAGVVLAALALVPLAEVWRQSPDLRHGWAAALLIVYLWWERSAEQPAARPREKLSPGWWILAVFMGLAALPMRLLLTPFALWPLMLWAYVALLVGGAALAAWLRAGWPGVRWLLAPCGILVSALPWPAGFETFVIYPLREAMAGLAAEVSNLLGRPALAVGTTVRLPSGWVGIDEACGGIRSLQACLMMALFFGEWFRFSWSRRLVLIACGVGAALAGNFSRVLFLSLSAGSGGEAAVHRAHDTAGWVALGASLLITGGAAWRWAGWRWPEVVASSPASATPVRAPGTAWLAVLVGLLVVNEAGTRWWFARGAREHAAVTRWTVALPESHWSFVADPLGDFAAEMLRPDFFTSGHWQGERNLELAAYYIEWRRGQVARFLPFAHNPTVCLPLSGCELVESLEQIDVTWRGLDIPFQAYRFNRRGEDLWVAFTIWDPVRARPLAEPGEYDPRTWWTGRWAEVVERRENQPAQLLTLSLGNVRGEPRELLRSKLVELLTTP
jgi:exosortase